MSEFKGPIESVAEKHSRTSSKLSTPPSRGHVDVLSAHLYFKNRGASDHRRFCEMVGITEMRFDDQNKYMSRWWYGKLRDQDNDQGKPSGLYPRVVAGYRWHTLQYWLVATLSNIFLWSQICFGAGIAALGGANVGNSYRAISIMITVFGALQTVLAGMLTYFKSRNQPNRARQSRNGLRKIKEEIENAECVFRSDTYQYKIKTIDPTGVVSTVVLNVDEVVRRLMARYEAVLQDAETNYPDIWFEAERTGAAGPMMVEKRVETLDIVTTTAAATAAAAAAVDKANKTDIKHVRQNGKNASVNISQDAISTAKTPATSIRTVNPTTD